MLEIIKKSESSVINICSPKKIDAQRCQVDFETNNLGPTLFLDVLVQFQSGHFGLFGKLYNALSCFYD